MAVPAVVMLVLDVTAAETERRGERSDRKYDMQQASHQEPPAEQSFIRRSTWL